MRLKKITNQTEFTELQAQWDALMKGKNSSPLPLTHAWISAWWKEFGANRILNIYCVYEQDQLIAIAPFYEEPTTYRRVPLRRLHLLTDGQSPYSDVIYKQDLSEQKIAELLELIIDSNKDELIVFAKLPKSSPTYRYFSQSDHRHNLVIKKNLATPTIQINCDWDVFFKKRSRKFRNSLHNKLNRFNRESDFKIEQLSIQNTEHPALQHIIDISCHSWKVAIKGDLGSNVAGRNFVMDLVNFFGPQNKVKIWLLWKNEVPIAYELHLIHDGIAYPIRADYDERYKQFSPGSILEYSALKHLFETGEAKEYYSCADNYWYLSNWTSDICEHYNVEIFSNCLKARTLHFLENRIVPIVRMVKSLLWKKDTSTRHIRPRTA